MVVPPVPGQPADFVRPSAGRGHDITEAEPGKHAERSDYHECQASGAPKARAASAAKL